MSQNGISSHQRDSRHLFKKHPGVECKIKGVLSPKQLPNIVEGTWGELNNDPTKQVNIITVGGPGKAWIEFKLYYLLQASDNMNVRFVILFL